MLKTESRYNGSNYSDEFIEHGKTGHNENINQFKSNQDNDSN